MTRRINLRLAETIRHRAAHVILHELKDPRVGFVTVTGVKLSPDRTHCVVYWSVFGTAGDRSKTRHALEDARPYVQRRIAEGLKTRTAPLLSFEFDASVEGAIRMGGLLKQLRDERGEPIDAPAGGEPGSGPGGEPGNGGAPGGGASDAPPGAEPTGDGAKDS